MGLAMQAANAAGGIKSNSSAAKNAASDTVTPIAKRQKVAKGKQELSSVEFTSPDSKESASIVNARNQGSNDQDTESIDDIAGQLMAPLVESFESKTGRKPNESEYNALVETLASDDTLMQTAAVAASSVNVEENQDGDQKVKSGTDGMSDTIDSVDDIAAKMVEPVLKSFREKTGRDPSESEYEMLISTLVSDADLMSSAAEAAAAMGEMEEDDDLEYECYANEVMTLKFAQTVDEQDADEFNPEYTHQVFAGDNANIIDIKNVDDKDGMENEKVEEKEEENIEEEEEEEEEEREQDDENSEYIRGYKGLNIGLSFTPSGLHAHLDITYQEKHSNPDKVDDIYTSLYTAMQPKLKDEKDIETIASKFYQHPAFVKTAKQFADKARLDSKFKPPACMVPLSLGKHKEVSNLVAYRASIKDIPEYHHLFDFLPLLFIDAASPLENSDPLWDVIMIFDIVDEQLYLAGYTTLYKFQETSTLRLSQILVLPPFQGMGIGTILADLAQSYRKEAKMECFDVEPPIAEGFLRLISKMDFRRFLDSEQLATVCANAGTSAVHAKDIDYKDFKKQLGLSKAAFSRCLCLFMYRQWANIDPEDSAKREAARTSYEEFVRTVVVEEATGDGENADDIDIESSMAFALEWHSSVVEKVDRLIDEID